jgi:acyl-CoA thioester hydrolase
MAIIKSKLPYFEILKVRYRDLDAQGHLYFANYLVYGDEVLGAYMEKLGLNLMNPATAYCMIFTVNIHCDYINEIAGDSDVSIYSGYSRLGNSSADAAFEIYDQKTGNLMAKGGLTQVFVDSQTRKSIPIPAFYREAIIQQQGYLDS